MTEHFYKKFYKQLGKLLYVVAKADGHIHDSEVHTIHEIVAKDLAPLEDSVDFFGTDAAFFTEFEFELLRDREANKDKVYKHFVEFVKEEGKFLDNRLKGIIINSVEKVAEAFHGTEHSEAELIADLKQRLA